MDISGLIGLKIIGLDNQSRRALKIRFRGGAELLIPSLYVRDAGGQDLYVQKLVGARITLATVVNSQFQITAIGRDGQTLSLVTTSTVKDSLDKPITLGNVITYNGEALTFLGQALTYGVLA